MDEKTIQKMVGDKPEIITFETKEKEELFISLYEKLANFCDEIVPLMEQNLKVNQKVSIVIGVIEN